MKHEVLIQELQDVATQLGVTIRFERGDFEGGYCILREQKILLVNRRLFPAKKASVLAMAMHEIGLEDMYLKPAVREYIEDEIAKATRSAH
ncbi:MAG TPA: hypothetical protein VF514_12950 [Bacteroidota bacterium]|jgi:hypothetical protein